MIVNVPCMIPRLQNQRTIPMNCAFSTIMSSNLGVTLCTLRVVMTTNLRHYYGNSYRMTENEDISNPCEVAERKTQACGSKHRR